MTHIPFDEFKEWYIATFGLELWNELDPTPDTLIIPPSLTKAAIELKVLMGNNMGVMDADGNPIPA